MNRKFIFRILVIVVFLLAVIFILNQIYISENNEKGLGSENLEGLETAVFAGGCFWCTESDFEKISGVAEAVSGYSGGFVENPSYQQVSSGGTGHVESVKVFYDSKNVSYNELLEVFWSHVNPTDSGGQFVDRGSQYLSVIFYSGEEQRTLAEESKEKLERSGIFDKPIVTEIKDLENFYEAENYHQDYYKKNSFSYNFYRFNSGRDQFLERVWTDENLNKLSELFEESDEVKYMKPSDEEIKSKLTPTQYYVTQQSGTEKPFENDYWDNKEEGIYVDVVTGEPLFSSKDKYESGTGWPSFTKPLASENIVEKKDFKLIIPRTEIRSKHGDSHLGHVFNDGPEPTGKRYCMNSAALRFIPKDKLEEEGYGEYAEEFD